VSEVSDTRESLLVRVKNPSDCDAWEQFSRIYRPAVYRLARGRGLQDAEAQDLAQRVMMSVAAAIPDWRRSGPDVRFRHWLRRVAKNEVVKVLTRRPRDQAGGGTSVVELLNKHPDSYSEIEVAVELEYRRQLVRRAAEIVRSRADEATWLAFSMTMIDGVSIAEAAMQLDRSEGMVYAARSRIVRRLRETVGKLEDD